MGTLMHRQNETLVERLRAEGTPLTAEAADKIEALRRRGKHWEKTAHTAQRRYTQTLIRHMSNPNDLLAARMIAGEAK